MDVYENEEQLKEWIHVHGCNSIFRKMNNVDIQIKRSVSDSIIVFGEFTLKGNIFINVVLKIVFEAKAPINNSLVVENQIYANIVSNLLGNFHTPHLVKYIATVPSCDLSLSDLPTQTRKELDRRMQQVPDKLYNKNKSIITVLTRTEGTTLADFLEVKPDQEDVLV